MTTLFHEIHIAAPVDKVWAALADLESVQHYNPMVASARYVSKARDGVGASRVCDFKPGGSATERVTEWRPNQMIAMEAVEHPWPMRGVRWRNELASAAGGTRLTQTLDYDFTGDAAMAAGMEAQWDQGMKAIFAALKAFVERNAQQTR
jgi:uncharacterized protein YndB with AHSA1/START domain